VTLAAAFSGIAYAFGSASSGVGDVRSSSWFRDDFINGANLTIGTAGTGAVQAGGGNTGRDEMGAVTCKAIAVADLAAWALCPALGPSITLGIGQVQLDLRAFATVSNGVNNHSFRLGAGDQASAVTAVDLVDGVYFESDYPNHGASPVWFACCANAGVRTKVTTGISPTGASDQRFRIIVAPNGASVSFFINEALVATIAANVPTNNLAPFAQQVKTLGAAIGFLIVDYVELNTTFTVQR